MYGVVRRYNTQPGTAEKIEQRVRDGFVPLIRALPGFVSYNLVRSTDGSLVSFGVFETQNSAEQSSHLAGDWVRENLASLIKNSPVILTGEVMVSATGPVASGDGRARGGTAERSSESRPSLS